MASEDVGDVLVAWDRKPLGLLTDRDLVVRVLARGLNPQTLLVWEVMSKPLVLVSATQDLRAAVDLMARHGVRRLPIVDEAGRLASILTFDDMLLLGLDGRPHLSAIVRRQLSPKQAGVTPVAAQETGLSFREVSPVTQTLPATQPVLAVARVHAQDLCTVMPDATIREVARLMVERDVGDVLVVVGRTPLGILTDRDLVVRVLATGADPDRVPAWELMSQPLVTVRDDAGVDEAVALMGDHGIRRLPIVDEAVGLVSVLTLDDILLLGLDGNLELSPILVRQFRPCLLSPTSGGPAPPPAAEPPAPPSRTDTSDHGGGIRFSRPVTSVARQTIIRPLPPPHKTKLDYIRAWLFWNRDWLEVTAWLMILGVVLATLTYLSMESGWLTLTGNSYEPKDEERWQYLERLQQERERETRPR